MMVPDHAVGGQPQLARRLRELRLHTWPGRTVTQRMLAEALGGRKPLSLSLISAWESENSSTVPPTSRLHQYATFFATERSVDGDQARLVPENELTPTEQTARDKLLQELLALREGRTTQPGTKTATSVRFDWTYPRGATIRIVCGKLDLDGEPAHPYTDPTNPNYTDLLTFADIDALVELFGHLWRLNPNSDIRFIRADRLAAAAEVKADRLTSHVVLLGGIGVNQLTKQVFGEAQLPIGQIERPDITDQGEVFELDGTLFTPKSSGGLLVEDVGLFARLPNPYNSRTTLTICNGVFAPGVLGAVRALTDNQLREQNESYLESRFAGADRFAILMRVPVALGTALTPDLQKESTRLYEWSKDAVPAYSDGQGRSE